VALARISVILDSPDHRMPELHYHIENDSPVRRERFGFRIHRDAFYSTAIGSIGFSRARSLSPYPRLRPCMGHALAPSLSSSRCEKILRDELPPSPSRGPATAMQFLIVGPSLLFPHRERHGFPCRATRYINALDRGEFKLSSCLPSNVASVTFRSYGILDISLRQPPIDRPTSAAQEESRENTIGSTVRPSRIIVSSFIFLNLIVVNQCISLSSSFVV